MSDITQIDRKDAQLARSVLRGNEDLVWALYDENSEFPDDFMITIGDLLDAKVEGKKTPTEEQIKEEYGITDNELTRMQSIAFQIPTARNCTCKHCGNLHQRPFDRTMVSLAEFI